mgnify:CR=1 FL=1
MTADKLFKRMAVDLAKQFGKDITLRRTDSTFDPGTGQTTETNFDFLIRAHPPKDFTTDEIADTLIQQGDTVVDVPAASVDMTATGASGGAAPTTSDKLLMDGFTWTLVDVGRAYGGSDVAIYRLHARK